MIYIIYNIFIDIYKFIICAQASWILNSFSIHPPHLHIDKGAVVQEQHEVSIPKVFLSGFFSGLQAWAPNQRRISYYWWWTEIRRVSAVDMVGLFVPHYLQGFMYSPGGCLGFLNHQPYLNWSFFFLKLDPTWNDPFFPNMSSWWMENCFTSR